MTWPTRLPLCGLEARGMRTAFWMLLQASLGAFEAVLPRLPAETGPGCAHVVTENTV